ncbi:hypothetical protein AAVH_13485 [Aphelenchoides avenae]|nr:hypothetical protein AAVH_13485 [Aphelenchus avenae]
MPVLSRRANIAAPRCAAAPESRLVREAPRRTADGYPCLAALRMGAADSPAALRHLLRPGGQTLMVTVDRSGDDADHHQQFVGPGALNGGSPPPLRFGWG